MKPIVFLLLNLAFAFYNMGIIWAHEVDIFRSWRLVGPESFPRLQSARQHRKWDLDTFTGKNCTLGWGGGRLTRTAAGVPREPLVDAQHI